MKLPKTQQMQTNPHRIAHRVHLLNLRLTAGDTHVTIPWDTDLPILTLAKTQLGKA